GAQCKTIVRIYDGAKNRKHLRDLSPLAGAKMSLTVEKRLPALEARNAKKSLRVSGALRLPSSATNGRRSKAGRHGDPATGSGRFGGAPCGGPGAAGPPPPGLVTPVRYRARCARGAAV
ncbi:unnamed protein product, partial [Amoebophrya sp. A120]